MTESHSWCCRLFASTAISAVLLGCTCASILHGADTFEPASFRQQVTRGGVGEETISFGQAQGRDVAQVSGTALSAKEELQYFAKSALATSGAEVHAAALQLPTSQPMPTTLPEGEKPWSAKPMSDLGVDIRPPAGTLPADRAKALGLGQNYCDWCASGRDWGGLCYCFSATGLYYRPLYFEEVNLERYGYGCYRCLQPAASAAHFFTRVPALPYLMAVDCPWECHYTLGHYRPGSCAPWRLSCSP